MNPELRQTLQRVSRNLESANETAQENFYTFSQHYIDPCIASIQACLISCTEPCFPSAAESRKRRRARSRTRGRAESNFDFYDDWNDELNEEDALLGWGQERLDRLLAGNQHPPSDVSKLGGVGVTGNAQQPRRQRGMSYGTRGNRRLGLPHEDGTDPTLIPGSSYLGFLPWRIAGRKLRYKPSAADLQEHLGGEWRAQAEAEPLIEEDSDEGQDRIRHQHHQRTANGRKRSSTDASQSTTNSLSSRGDLIPSDEEADAVPLGDEFAVVLEQRNTDDCSSGKTGTGKRPANSRLSTRSVSNRSIKSGTNRSQKSEPAKVDSDMDIQEPLEISVPTLGDLKQEEDQIRQEEDTHVERKREAAITLAQDRGLLSDAKVVRSG